MIIYNSEFKIYSSSLINDDGYFSGFGTRQLGDARKTEIVARFFHANGISYKTIVLMQQIHSVNVSQYKSQQNDQFQLIEDTDGVFTSEFNTVLITRTADCVPIQFCDKKNGIIGISHQGWRGSLKKMVHKMIQQMMLHGAQLQNIKVALGPSIGSCCYEISNDTYYEFLYEFNGYSQRIFTMRQGKWHINLILLNYLLLTEMGIPKKHIDFFPFCTRCDSSRFFSFRRDKKQDFGEMMSFIVKKS